MVLKLGSTEPFQGFDEDHLKNVTQFSFCYIGQKRGSRKAWKSTLRVRRVVKFKNHWTKVYTTVTFGKQNWFRLRVSTNAGDAIGFSSAGASGHLASHFRIRRSAVRLFCEDSVRAGFVTASLVAVVVGARFHRVGHWRSYRTVFLKKRKGEREIERDIEENWRARNRERFRKKGERGMKRGTIYTFARGIAQRKKQKTRIFNSHG